MKKEAKEEEELKNQKTRKVSIKEGSFSAATFGLGNQYIVPYALALNANNAHIGFLTSFTGLIYPLSQLYGSKLMEKISRKNILSLFVFLQALMWLPIILLGYFFNINLFQNYLPLILIIFYSVYLIFGGIALPSWFSLMGDIVPGKIRGKYFSKRNRITGLFTILAIITSAFILDLTETKGYVLIGFSIIFFLAFLTRWIASRLFKKHHEPNLKLEKGYYFSFFQFIKHARKNNFGKFVIFISMMHFATAIASPFFIVYMLRDLQFSYTTFMIIQISSSVYSLMFLPIWGKFSDKYGNREILRVSSLFIPFVPILWFFSESPYYLAFVPQLVAGASWAAFNLAASNFIYDSVSQQRRGICVSYNNLLMGIGIFFGASLGGLLAQYLTISFMNKLLFIFLISGLARSLVTIFFLPKVKEIRKVKKPEKLLHKLKHLNPIRDVLGLENEIARVTKRIAFQT